MTTDRPRVNVLLLAETYLFQVYFLFFAFRGIWKLNQLFPQVRPAWNLLTANWAHPLALQAYSSIVLMACLVVFNFLNAYSLYIRKNLRVPPQGFKDTFIPFVSTFAMGLYNVTPFFRSPGNIYLIPAAERPSSLLAGLILAIIGIVISVSALYSLRESFAVFVQVREIVVRGLYRHVRHPMYLGYFFTDLGFFLMVPRLFTLFLVLLLLLLRFYRAILEEEKLSRNSVEYQDYKERTPFLFPGIGGLFSRKREDRT